MIKIKLNNDKELVEVIRRTLKENDGFCPCRVEKTKETRCMCKDFLDMVEAGKTGLCHCGLYEGVKVE